MSTYYACLEVIFLLYLLLYLIRIRYRCKRNLGFEQPLYPEVCRDDIPISVLTLKVTDECASHRLIDKRSIYQHIGQLFAILG